MLNESAVFALQNFLIVQAGWIASGLFPPYALVAL